MGRSSLRRGPNAGFYNVWVSTLTFTQEFNIGFDRTACRVQSMQSVNYWGSEKQGNTHWKKQSEHTHTQTPSLSLSIRPTSQTRMQPFHSVVWSGLIHSLPEFCLRCNMFCRLSLAPFDMRIKKGALDSECKYSKTIHGCPETTHFLPQNIGEPTWLPQKASSQTHSQRKCTKKLLLWQYVKSALTFFF